MANGVWHSGLNRLLELDKEDLGLPGSCDISIPDLIVELLQPVASRERELLVCREKHLGRECKAELHGVKSPHMYVRRHRGPDGVLRLRAAHLPTVHEMTTEESDRHKAMKDFIDRTCEGAGLERMVEKSTKNRSSRPDVTIIGTGGISLGCEAQFYNANPGTVLRRSKAHSDSGLVPAWITHDDTFHLVDRAPWMLIRDVTWREINNAADLPLVGGYRVLANWHCTAAAQRPCPTGKSKTGCGKRHLQWDTPLRLDSEDTGWTGYRNNRRGVTVGRTLVGSATGSVVPLYVPGRKDHRSGSFMWVPAEDRDTWADYGEVQTPIEEADPEGDHELHFSGRDADTTCQFGDQTWRPSASLPRRGIGSVELLLTVDEPAAPIIPQQRNGATTVRDAAFPPLPLQPAPPTTQAAIAAPSTTASLVIPRRMSPDERAAAAAALGCPPWELGPCNGCGQPIRRYGRNAPVACAPCRDSACGRTPSTR